MGRRGKKHSPNPGSHCPVIVLRPHPPPHTSPLSNSIVLMATTERAISAASSTVNAPSRVAATSPFTGYIWLCWREGAGPYSECELFQCILTFSGRSFLHGQRGNRQ